MKSVERMLRTHKCVVGNSEPYRTNNTTIRMDCSVCSLGCLMLLYDLPETAKRGNLVLGSRKRHSQPTPEDFQNYRERES